MQKYIIISGFQRAFFTLVMTLYLKCIHSISYQGVWLTPYLDLVGGDNICENVLTYTADETVCLAVIVRLPLLKYCIPNVLQIQ